MEHAGRRWTPLGDKNSFGVGGVIRELRILAKLLNFLS